MDCKKALGETSGNVDEAMDWLRQHGAAKAAQKVSGRDAEEGLVACMVSADGKSAAIVKVSSETDFAGKSQAFVDFVHHVATATIGSNETGSLDSEHVLALQSSSKSVKTALEEAIVAIRENLGIASAIKWTSDDGMLVSYVHGKVSEGSAAGSSAAMVELVGSASVSPEVIREAGRKVAMHIVASKPTYLNVEDIPEEILAKERAILQSQVRFVRFSLGFFVAIQVDGLAVSWLSPTRIRTRTLGHSSFVVHSLAIPQSPPTLWKRLFQDGSESSTKKFV